MTDPIPSGYFIRNTPKSPPEATNLVSHDKIRTISKEAIRKYIASFFNEEGKRRDIMKSVFPDLLPFITDVTFNEDSDKTKRKTQLAIFYERVKEQMPAILIADTGVVYRPTGLGLSEGAQKIGNTIQSNFNVIRDVSIVVTAMSEDQTTAGFLGSALEIIFGNLRNFLITGVLYSTNELDNWELRLPLVIEPGSLEREQLGEQDLGFIWFTQTTLNCQYEDHISIRKELPDFKFVDKDLMPPLTLDAPDTMIVGKRTPIYLRGYRETQRIVVDDYTKASIDQDNNFNITILPRKAGKFKIQIIDMKKIDRKIGDVNNKVVAEKEITAVFN